MEELTRALLADGAVIQDAIAKLYAARDIPYDLPNAKKNAKKRVPYRKPLAAAEAPESPLRLALGGSSLFFTCMDPVELQDSSLFYSYKDDWSEPGETIPLRDPQSSFTQSSFISSNPRRRDPRFDFGPAFGVKKCSTCRKISWNRGDEATRMVYCRPCFVSRQSKLAEGEAAPRVPLEGSYLLAAVPAG